MVRHLWAVILVGMILTTSGVKAQHFLVYLPLKGAGPISVLVENLDASIKDTGLTADQIKTKAELELRTHKVPVKQDDPLSSSAYLYVNVNTASSSSSGMIAYNIIIEHREFVNLVGNGRLGTVATLWRTGGLGISTPSHVKDNVLSNLVDCVDKYANDYLTANEKTSGK